MHTSNPCKKTHTSDSRSKKQAIKTVCMFHHRLLDETSLIMLIRKSYQEGVCSFKCHHSKAPNHEITYFLHIFAVFTEGVGHYFQDLPKYHCYRFELEIRHKSEGLKECVYTV